jgi:mono/diheme cytochrome c family protein
MIACLRALRRNGNLKTALVVVFAIVAAGPLASAQTPAGKQTAAEIFKAKCETCHGQDGSGTALGHRLHVKDLRSSEVQSRSSAELAQVIHDGQSGMPAWGGKLDDDQIQALVKFVRRKASK